MAGVVVHASVFGRPGSRGRGKAQGRVSERGVSIAACGARTGRVRSQSSTTSRPSSPSLRLTV